MSVTRSYTISVNYCINKKTHRNCQLSPYMKMSINNISLSASDTFYDLGAIQVYLFTYFKAKGQRISKVPEQ